MISSAILDWYYSRGCELMPARANDPRRPLAGWRTDQYTREQVELAASLGRGVLWRLSLHDFVIDVDLYKSGAAAMAARLDRDFLGSPSSVAPTVHTPRGGRHYYFRAPAGIDIRVHTEEYGPHVEFLSRGRYVVIAGSPHPGVPGVTYQFDYGSPLDQHLPICPIWLARKIELRRPEGLEQSESPMWSAATLGVVLAHLPSTAYGSHDAWYPILCAAHYATGGSVEGAEVFIDWSTSDPDYADAGAEIRRRWESLSISDKPIYITHSSLLKEVRTRVGYMPPDVQGAVDWTNKTIEVTHHPSMSAAPAVAGGTLPAQPPATPTPAIDATTPTPPTQQEPCAARIERITEKCDRLTEVSESWEIESAIEDLAHLDALQMARFIKRISLRTGVPAPEVRKRTLAKAADLYAAKKDLGRRARTENAESLANGGEDDQDPVPTDLGQYLAELVLQQYYGDGAHLVYTAEGQYWEYDHTHWVPRSEADVDGCINSAAVRLRAELSTAAGVSVSAMMSQAAHILRAMCARKGRDVFHEAPPSVINCQNGELWIDPKSGKPEFRRHSPKSGLRFCLGIDYDPSARCPIWLDAITGMFAPLGDPVAVAAHLMEMIGYTIQPTKNYAAWVMLYGTGNNGKSTVLDVMTALLGGSVVSVGLKELARDPHAYDSVAHRLAVLEDDLKKGTRLPDDILKKLSENKLLTANPKHRDKYSFVNTATAWVSTNHWPPTSDMSEGMKRRPCVFEFRRDFDRDGIVDPDLRKKIVDGELSGVLNTAIAGLMRLRARGRIERPADCEESRHTWLDGSNQMRRFIADRTMSDEASVSRVNDLFDLYSLWCDSEGIKRSYSRSGLIASLKTAGYVVQRVNRVDCVVGLRTVEEW